MKRTSDSFLANSIRNKWIKRLAKRGNWERVISYYEKDKVNTASRCYYNEALIRTGRKQVAFQQSRDIWMTPKKLPDSCFTLFNLLIQNGQLSRQDVWNRIALIMDKPNLKLASKLQPFLSNPDKVRFKLWKKIHKKPDQYLAGGSLGEDHPKIRQIIIHGIKRLARKKPKQAERHWKNLRLHYAFTASEKGQAESVIYARLARRHESESLRHLSLIPDNFRSNDASVWMARMGLRTANWSAVLNATRSMDAETRSDDAWIYWRARALAALGQKQQAQNLYSSLAGNATFYGFMSADHLSQPYTALYRPLQNRSAQINQIKKMPNIQRALELFAVGMNSLASKEWFHSIDSFNTEAKLAAAELALQHKQPFTAIVTVSRTKDWNQVHLRFPLLYEDMIRHSATEQKINPAWVYGVMRRESAFKEDALSRAKATGLMQLLPKTAQGVAKKLGMGKLTRKEMNKPSINIRLGSGYLSQMLKRFDGSYPKATAAYNAGPGRIPGWLPTTKLASDQWIESIPFNETRRYVRAVMAYTTIYDHKLTHGKGQRLSERLSPIIPDKTKR